MLAQVPPILPAGDLALVEREVDSNDDKDSAEATGAAAAASLVRTLRSWSHDRTESVNSAQEALATRAFQAEQAAVDALRLVSRAEGHTRALVADLAHGATVRCPCTHACLASCAVSDDVYLCSSCASHRLCDGRLATLRCA